MKKHIIYCMAFPVLLTLTSCSGFFWGSSVRLDGAQVEQTMNLPDETKTEPVSLSFNRFSFGSSSYLVRVFSLNSATDVPHVYYNVPSDFVSKYGFDVSYLNKTVTFATPVNHNFTGGSIAIDVYANVNDIVVDGGLKIDLDASKSSTLSIAINGAASINTTSPLALTTFETHINGSGSLTLNGTADSALFGIDGTGSIKARNLTCKKAEVSIDGAGSVEIYASESIKASVNGTGRIVYYGNPSQVESKVTGLGDIRKG